MNYALITGASSGIGHELALIFAKNKHNLVLVARDESKLTKIAENLKKSFKIDALIYSIDLSEFNAAHEVYNFIKDKSISVDYLINNAGFYVKGCFKETSWKDEKELIMLQCINHTHLTKLILPELIKNNEGGILNISSIGSFVPGPYNAIYCAAKSFVLSFSEALAEELSNTKLKVTTLCPGGTNSNFQKINLKRSWLFPQMSALKVAEIGYKSLMKGKRVIVPGFINKIQVLSVRFIPRKIITKLTSKMVN